MTRDEEAELGIEKPEDYEHKDVGAAGVMIFMAGLLISIGLGMVFAWWLYGVFSAQRAAVEPFPEPKLSQIPPEPRIQSAPQIDLQRLRAHEDAVLGTYGWVDKQAGTVHIPIGRAIELVAQRGLPARTGNEPMPTVPDTGPESGGPQTGIPVPRFNPATPFEPSRPLRGARESLPGPERVIPGMVMAPSTAPAPRPGERPLPDAARKNQR